MDPVVQETPLVWIHPRGWKTDNRTRRYISLAERNYSREGDLGVLRRTVYTLLQQQDERGSFYSDEDYMRGDVVDDQIGAAAMLAYFLTRTGSDEKIHEALVKAVRFHLDYLVFSSPDRAYRYSRFHNDRDTPGDWCNTLWCLGAGTCLLQYAEPYLGDAVSVEYRGVLAEYWSFVSTFPTRDENPCHNQMLAYIEIGIEYARMSGREELVSELLDFYHGHVRRLRILDRGYRIYSEFNQWDSHYSVLSWMILERLFVETAEPAFAEDAQQMAFYFNEYLSAGGYCWGGSRNNESGLDEFPNLFTASSKEFGFDRMHFPEPSHLWNRLVVNGHGGKGLITRIEMEIPSRESKKLLSPTPWHFQKDNASVCLSDDRKLHHLSSGGLELIPVAGMAGLGSGVRWLYGRTWRQDRLQINPPVSSAGFDFIDSKPIRTGNVSGVSSMQRGYVWETRQWWISAGSGLLWITQLIPHGPLQCDGLDFLLGTPILTRLGGRIVPVSNVESAEGDKADTQGAAVTVSSLKFLRFGDLYVGATAPLEFIRPSADAFHTFPLPAGQLWRDCLSSNHIRIRISEEPKKLDCRESLFFAVQIGSECPGLEASAGPGMWKVPSGSEIFQARQTQGIWRYTIHTATKEEELPRIGFCYRD